MRKKSGCTKVTERRKRELTEGVSRKTGSTMKASQRKNEIDEKNELTDDRQKKQQKQQMQQSRSTTGLLRTDAKHNYPPTDNEATALVAPLTALTAFD